MSQWTGKHTVYCKECGGAMVNTCTCNRDWCVACDAYCPNKECSQYFKHLKGYRS